MADVAGAFDMNSAAPATLPDGAAGAAQRGTDVRADLGMRHRSARPQQAPQRRGLPAHQRGHQRRAFKLLTGSPAYRRRLDPTRSCAAGACSRCRLGIT